LTERGSESSKFAELLARHGVRFDHNIEARPQLEQALLESRFFDAQAERASQGNDSKQPRATSAELVYVTASGGAIDRVWQQMKNQPQHFASVSVDIALKPQDMAVFRQLQQTRDLADWHSGAGTAPDVAHRLEMTPGWDGVPADPAVSQGLLEEFSGSPLAPESDAPAADSGPLSSHGNTAPLLGGEVPAEALFIVRRANAADGPGPKENQR
jgi:hypothetical protein